MDSAFDPGTISGGALTHVDFVSVQTNGKVLIVGDFSIINGTNRNTIARLNENGSLDVTFDPGTVTGGSSLDVQSDGKVVVVGVIAINEMALSGIARLNADGILDTNFNCGVSGGSIYAVAVQPDGKVLIGGGFTSINGTNRNGIARLNTDGSLDGTFIPGGGVGGSVFSLALQMDGKVLAGGQFVSVEFASRNRIARFNANGSLDSTFDPGSGANFDVRSVAVQKDGKLLLGGDFTSINDVGRAYVARLLGDPIELAIQKANDLSDQVVLLWTNAALLLQSAPIVTGPFSNVHGATSPFTNLIADPQRYFRLKAP